MPTPKEGESKQEFVDRCIPIVLEEGTAEDGSQANAICHSIWEQHQKGLSPMYAIRRTILEPIKSFEAQDGKTKYRAMAVRFGSKEETDWYGTYFNKDTEYYLDWFKSRPWVYDHGLNPMMGPVRIGDWTEVEWTEEGIFFVGELLEHFKYQDAVEELIKHGVLYPSTGTLSYLMDWDWNTGHIRKWPIVELSSTTRPAEYRMEAMSPEVVKAVRTLEGGMDMGAKDLLSKLHIGPKAELPDEELEQEQEQGQEQDPAMDEAGVEVELVEQVGEFDLGELAETLAAYMGLDQFRHAIEGLDAVLAATQGRLEALEKAHNQLAETKAKSIKEAMTDGQNWFGSLFVASRDAEPEPDPDDDEVRGPVDSGQEGPAAIIQRMQNQG